MNESTGSAEVLGMAASTLASAADESRSAIERHISEVKDFAAAVSGAGNILSKLGEGDLHAAVALLAQACAEIQSKNATLEARFETLQHRFSAVWDELESVRSEASTDPLTGLPNRRVFDRSLIACVERAEKSLKNLVSFGFAAGPLLGVTDACWRNVFRSGTPRRSARDPGADLHATSPADGSSSGWTRTAARSRS